MDRVRTQIGINGKNKYTGKDVVVGVLDSGVDEHPDLSNRIVSFVDFLDGKKNCYDDYGHGTHICGIIAGNGLESGGIYKGIAPNANLVVGRILDRNGSGERQDLLRGLNWILKIIEQYPIRVLNISFSFSKIKNDYYGMIILSRLKELTEQGVIVVCAAGNTGPERDTISYIASSEYVLTVGCNDGPYFKNHKKRCEFYSGTGNCMAIKTKPDLVAPGTEIVSCSHMYQKSGVYYTAKSGTSMATAIVSGAAALVFEKYPHFSAEQCAKYLKDNTFDLHMPSCKQGNGMINLSKIDR